jgi:hypothetical protein
MRTLAAALLLAATSARADTLADLEASLARLTARQPLRATFTSSTTDSTSGRFANHKGERHAALEAAQDASVFRIEFPRALLETMDGISPLGVSHSLDYAAPLLEQLRLGTVLDEKRVVYAGAPARLLVLKMKPAPPRADTVQIGSVRYTEDRMSVWIGADNLPLAAERTQKAAAGFLMFKGETASRRAWQFTRKDDHLVVARFEETSSFSGLGQKGELHRIDTIAIHS